jgi:hypothetical protein
VTAIKADIIVVVVVWFSGHDKISIADGLRLEETRAAPDLFPAFVIE